MTLRDWIARSGISYAEAARRLGVANTTVLRWCSGEIYPTRENLAAIRDLTRGRVGPEDFPLERPEP